MPLYNNSSANGLPDLVTNVPVTAMRPGFDSAGNVVSPAYEVVTEKMSEEQLQRAHEAKESALSGDLGKAAVELEKAS